MQRTPQAIKDTLLKALDQDYNVIDMPAVVEIIGILEQTPITKDALETTRLGKYINELRRKTSNELLAKRAKDLVRRWRHLIQPEPATPGGNGVRAVHTLQARAGQLSPGLAARMSQPASPSSRVSSLSPENKVAASPGISPAISPRLPLLSTPIGRISTPVSPAAGGDTPTATPPTRGRGRPPKNKNKHKRPLSPAHTTDLVPKTSPANKRLRKDSPEVLSHVVRANGVCTPKLPVNDSEVPGRDPKKRGRRKGSRNSHPDEEDAVKEAMASIARTPKVKTTRELLHAIQKESSLDNLRSRTLSSLGVSKGEKLEKLSSLGVSKAEKLEKPSPSSTSNVAATEHIHKFLRSQNERYRSPRKEDVKPSRTVIRPPTPPSPSGSDIIDVEKVSGCEGSPIKPPPDPPPVETAAPQPPKTVEEILAQLPRINHNEILWSDSDDDSGSDAEERVREVTEEDVLRLHSDHQAGLNGNMNEGAAVSCPPDAPHGLLVPVDSSCGASEPSCPADCQFREWHETLSRVSYNSELLHILPYVIID